MTTSSPQVKYAFALNSEGTIISADSASRGVDYSCPGFAGVMIPVLGSQKARHFRHFRECCVYESYLHKFGKVAFYHFYDEALQRSKPVGSRCSVLNIILMEFYYIAWSYMKAYIEQNTVSEKLTAVVGD